LQANHDSSAQFNFSTHHCPPKYVLHAIPGICRAGGLVSQESWPDQPVGAAQRTQDKIMRLNAAEPDGRRCRINFGMLEGEVEALA